MIAVIDYGMGNLRSVEKALEVAGGNAKVTSSGRDIARAEKIVFPGVGSFGAAMKELTLRGLIAPIKEAVASGMPFLGLCLGLQLLFEKSEEAPGVKGLGVLRGNVKKFRFTNDERPRTTRPFLLCSSSFGGQVGPRVRDTRTTNDGLKVPHMGWNRIVKREASFVKRKDILKGVPDGAYMYFVHSYYVRPKDKGVILTTTDYGGEFVSGVRKDNIYGLQFHPEKSQMLGLKIMENFVRLPANSKTGR